MVTIIWLLDLDLSLSPINITSIHMMLMMIVICYISSHVQGSPPYPFSRSLAYPAPAETYDLSSPNSQLR